MCLSHALSNTYAYCCVCIHDSVGIRFCTHARLKSELLFTSSVPIKEPVSISQYVHDIDAFKDVCSVREEYVCYLFVK